MKPKASESKPKSKKPSKAVVEQPRPAADAANQLKVDAETVEVLLVDRVATGG